MDYDRLLEGASDIGFRMLSAGAEIYRVEDTVGRLLDAYGVKGEVFAIPNCLIVSLVDGEGRVHTRMRRQGAMTSTDIEAVERLNALSRSVCAETPPPERLLPMAEETAGRCLRYSLPMDLLGYFLGSFFFTFLFHGGLAEALTAGAAGMAAGLVVTGLDALRVNYFFRTILAAMTLGVAVYAPRALGAPVDTGVAVIGALMTLVPGILFTSFMCDLITGDAVSGVSAFLRAVLTAAGMAIGTGTVLWLFGAMGLTVEGVTSGFVYPPAVQCAAAFVACAGFAVLYNAHGAVGIALCSLGGALGWAVDLAVGAATGSGYVCCFIATVVITVYAEVMARVRRCPMTAYLVVSYFPLVPGAYIFYTMYYAIHGEMELCLEAGIHTLGVAACIAMGTLLVSTAVWTWAAWRGRRKT